MHNPSSPREAFVGSHLRDGGYNLLLESYASLKTPAPKAPKLHLRYCALDVKYIGQTGVFYSRLTSHIRCLVRMLHHLDRSTLPTYKRAISSGTIVPPCCLIPYARTQPNCKLIDEAHDIKMASPTRNTIASLKSPFGFQQQRRGVRQHKRVLPDVPTKKSHLDRKADLLAQCRLPVTTTRFSLVAPGNPTVDPWTTAVESISRH